MNILQFTVSPESLRSAFELATKVVPNATTLDILKHALLVARNDTIIITASNMELTVTASVPAVVTTPGSVAIPSKIFHEWLREISGGEIVATLSDNFKMKLVRGTDKTTLACMDSEDYPDVGKEIAGDTVLVPAEQFARMVDRVAFSAHEDLARPQLNGIKVVVEGGYLTMVTTDGLRLSEAKESIESDATATALIQSKSMIEVARAAKGAGSVRMTLGNPTTFEVMGHPQLETVKFTCPTIAAQFPAWEKFMPTTSNTISVVPTSELLSKLKLANLIARDTNNRVLFTVESDHIDIHALSAEIGDCDYVVSASTNGGPVSIMFNSTYAKQAIEAVNSEKVELRIISSLSKALFVIPGESTYRHMLMPMQQRDAA